MRGAVILAAVYILLIISCKHKREEENIREYEPFEEGVEIGRSGGSSAENGIEISEDKIFIKDEEGKIEFKTNNGKYWGVRGYTMWKFLGEEIDKKEPCIEVVKKEGAGEAGYGLVCYSTKKEEGEKEYRMLCILIHIDGKYSIGHVKNGEYKHIEWKKSSEKLHRGYGVRNRIKVKREENKIKIYFNEEKEEAYIINDSGKYNLGEGEAGVIAVISSKDKFPDNYVWLEYKPVKF
ncbi:hypothetical protein [Treponema pedis]|uniref:Lipoprotein n=1 Tax=Treponema pedis TaxID=409322 RepID=A0A7S6WQ14_9SPIR|nr:hypothetical protein [Treponema pedis]QOW61185.1 hypothetical protein IFE08_01895 [Treponema pedis]QOW61620.1 hypothetical protein IFE08_04335 [Treponema pedis]QOW61908.1 hypothetical protein IFE08_06010 [Treponema pedis]